MSAPASRALAVLALAILSTASSARATITIEVPPERPRSEALAEALRDQLLAALAECPPGALVVRVSTSLPGEAPRPHALIEALLAPTMSALGASERWPGAHLASFATGDGAAARAGRLGYDVLADVSVRAVGNFLAIEGSTWTTSPPAQRGTFALRTRIDAELRAYLGGLERVSEETIVARTAELPGRGYVAMAAADLDGDGSTELALVDEGSVSIVRLGASRFGVRVVEVARAPLPTDVPLAASPTRRPLATATRIDGAIVARASVLAAPITVALEGGSIALARARGPCPDAAFPIEGGCAELVPGRDFFDDDITRASPEGPSSFQTPGTFYVRAARTLRTRDGQVVAYEAIVTPHGRLAVRVGERSVGDVGYGTALAIADLDDDGSAELLASGASAAGAGDQLTMLRALPRGALHVVWRSEPIEGSVWIASAADLDGDGLEELLAIEEPTDARGAARLWIVR